MNTKNPDSPNSGALNILRNLGYTIYYRMPGFLHFIFWPVILLRLLRLSQWLIKGKEVSSGQPLSMFFAGSLEMKNYFAGLAYGELYQENYLGADWAWRIIKQIRTGKKAYPLIITEVSPNGYKLSRGNDSFFIPLVVQTKEVDLTRSIADATAGNESLKSDIQLIEKYRYQFEITSDLSWYDYFYYQMYVPYVTKRHGTTAIVSRYDNLLVKLKNLHGELLFIKQAEEIISGVILTTTKNVGKLVACGIKDGNPEYLQRGALGALYYFAYLYLQQKGCRTMDLGYCRSFLKDGVLRYKRKWEPRIHDQREPGFWLKFRIENNAVRSFLVNNPFIFADDTGLNGAAFVDTETQLTYGDFRNLYKNYHFEGLPHLFIYRCGNTKCIGQDTVPHRFAGSISLKSLNVQSQKNKSAGQYASLEDADYVK